MSDAARALPEIEDALKPGTKLREFEIRRQLGSGGFGAVYRAVHPLIGKAAAIKVLNRQFSANPEIVSRFVAEARAVNQIRHRNIIDIFSFGVLVYAIAMKGTSIYELVSGAYQITLVAAFVPLLMGLYWRRATTQGAALSILLGIGTWVLFFPQVSTLGEAFPGQLAGLSMAFVGMVAGSLVPQWVPNHHAHTHHLVAKGVEP